MEQRRRRRPSIPPMSSSSFYSDTSTQQSEDEEVSTAVTWPIILAVIPTLGAFFAGSADVWSDFVMSLLILYYVYKWITVPWENYETARRRRIIHQSASTLRPLQHKLTAEELRHHEHVNLAWVIASPFIVAYTLRFSRYFLTNHERYLGYFQISLFVLGALIRPLHHVSQLLQEKAESLQNDAQDYTSDLNCDSPATIGALQDRMDQMLAEIEDLYDELATKRDVGNASVSLQPKLEQLAHKAAQMEQKETKLEAWAEDRFKSIQDKIGHIDQMILYRIEQDQHRASRRTLFTLMYLPIQIALWASRSVTHHLLPPPTESDLEPLEQQRRQLRTENSDDSFDHYHPAHHQHSREVKKGEMMSL
ncbi:hypothetical protein BCR43DRAFT_475525 [Syncephalastrum racemosum]|uniref:Uncharacterized protein n=1 Tax=Syncephalastrum racemosum TaxID=13706 RepID=A0A1X2HA91_SYNRA|nr:hypothetical protein BCR43DRAFT_475525 [Syncephalastrum racemosum]